MKLDCDQVLCHGTVGHKLDSKPFECNDNALDSIGLKSGNGIVKESQNGVLCDMKFREDGMTNDNEKEVKEFVAPITSTPPNLQSFEDSDFYMNRTVMERDLPELVVCYQENTYDVVKDICIDERVPSIDKFFFDAAMDDKSVCTYMPPETDQNNEMGPDTIDLDMCVPDLMKSSENKEKKDLHLPILDVLKSSDEINSKHDFSNGNDLKDVMLTGEVKDDMPKKTADDAGSNNVSLGDLLSKRDLGPQHESSNGIVVEELSPQKPSGIAALSLAPACEKSENGSEKAILDSPPMLSTAEDLEGDRKKATLETSGLDPAAEKSDVGHNEEVQSRHSMKSEAEELDSDSKEAKLAGLTLDVVIQQYIDKTSKEHLEPRNSFSHEITNSNSGPNQLQYSHGESSFSAAGPVSGLITYSGPIAYSGSLSLRSDSSTTSTRSFAFPILQSEWNSSPVRMAKAERRPRSWKQGLLCCRF